MVKVYFCDKYLSNGVLCQERDPTKFDEGRYSSCKACRTELSNKIHKNKRKGITEEVKKEREGSVDPTGNLKEYIIDVIKTSRFDKLHGRNILDSIVDNDEMLSCKMSSDADKDARLGKLIESHNTNIKILMDKILDLENEIFVLKNKNKN